MVGKNKNALVVTIACGLLVAGALIGLWQLDRPLAGGEGVAIDVPGDDTLAGTYYPGTIDQGVLLLEGFGSDQTAMRPLASQYAAAGYHVLTFDFSGHGRSPGGLDFNNAGTDRMAKQVMAADAILRNLSGLPADRIMYLGHSLGARVGLQASAISGTPPKTLVLMGTQVNLSTNVQAEFFTGTQDPGLDWVRALGPANPRSDIYLVSGTWDDILTPDAAYLLAAKLSGVPVHKEEGHFIIYQANPLRFLQLYPYLLHNYEIYGEVIKPDRPFSYSPGMTLRIVYWAGGIAGLFFALFGASKLAPPLQRSAPGVEVTRLGRFLIGKVLLWLPALIPGTLIAAAVFFVPLGTPVFNLYYLGFFGGYGVLIWFLYRAGKMPGVMGKLSLTRSEKADGRGTWIGTGFLALVLLAVSGLARSGWWHTFPLNHRLVWLAVFTPVTALGFVIGYKEIELLKGKSWAVWLNGLIGLLPFFLYAGFLAALGSLSGVVGSVQGLVILALAILTGSLVYKLSKRPWMAALYQAFLLYWLVLPQGVLFK